MELVNFIICDDIRNEVGNKHSLMGIYDEILEFYIKEENKNQWPKIMRLGVFARIKFNSEDNITDLGNFKLIMEQNGEKTILGLGNFPHDLMKTNLKLNIAIVIENFTFKAPGKLNFSYEIYNKNQQLLTLLKPNFTLNVSEKITS